MRSHQPDLDLILLAEKIHAQYLDIKQIIGHKYDCGYTAKTGKQM